MKIFNAYNEAVKLELQALKEDSPVEYEQLDETVLLMQGSGSKEFCDQTAEVQKRYTQTPKYVLPFTVLGSLLELFPGEIISTLKGWQYQTGARMYVLAVWGNPHGGPCGFEHVLLLCLSSSAHIVPATQPRIVEGLFH
jgi:hypothetical protein